MPISTAISSNFWAIRQLPANNTNAKSIRKGNKRHKQWYADGFWNQGPESLPDKPFQLANLDENTIFPGLLIISCTISVLHPSRSSLSSPSYKQAIQQKYLPAPNCFICRYCEGLPVGLYLHRHSAAECSNPQLLAHQDPRSFLLSCFLVSQTQHAPGVILFQKQDFALALIPFSLSFNSIQAICSSNNVP